MYDDLYHTRCLTSPTVRHSRRTDFANKFHLLEFYGLPVESRRIKCFYRAGKVGTMSITSHIGTEKDSRDPRLFLKREV